MSIVEPTDPLPERPAHPAFAALLARAMQAEERLLSEREGARAALGRAFAEAPAECLGPLALAMGPCADAARSRARGQAIASMGAQWDRMDPADRARHGRSMLEAALAIPKLIPADRTRRAGRIGWDDPKERARMDPWARAACAMLGPDCELPSSMTLDIASQPSPWLWLRARPRPPEALERARMVVQAMRAARNLWLPSLDDTLERLCCDPWTDEAAEGARALMDPEESMDALAALAHLGYGRNALAAACAAAEPGPTMLPGVCAGARKGYTATTSRMASHGPARGWGSLLRARGWEPAELEEARGAFAMMAIGRRDMQAYLAARGAGPGPSFECSQARAAFGEQAFAAAERRWLSRPASTAPAHAKGSSRRL